MSILKKNELKSINTKQIEEKLKELRKDLLKLNSQRAVGTTMESPGRIKLIKRTIARLLTLHKLKSQEEVKIKKLKPQGGKEKK